MYLIFTLILPSQIQRRTYAPRYSIYNSLLRKCHTGCRYWAIYFANLTQNILLNVGLHCNAVNCFTVQLHYNFLQFLFRGLGRGRVIFPHLTTEIFNTLPLHSLKKKKNTLDLWECNMFLQNEYA